MAKSKTYKTPLYHPKHMGQGFSDLRHRERHNAPLGKSKGGEAWQKVRRRIRRKLLDR